jgi:hypothetical protein
MKKMNESRHSLIRKYADLIIEFNEYPLIQHIDDNASDVSKELTSLGIPTIYQEEAFDMAKNILLENGQFDDDTIDLDEILNEITNSDFILNGLYESEASDEAKAKGLVHLGFGLWGKKKGGAAQFKSVDGKLVPANSAAAKPKKDKDNDKKDKKIDDKKDNKKKDDNKNDKKDDKKSKSTDEKKSSASKKKDDDDENKPEKKGIHDIKRLSGNKYRFSYTLDGRPKKILLTSDEIERLTKKNDTIKYIIQTRLELMKKQKQKGKFKKTFDARKKEKKSDDKKES